MKKPEKEGEAFFKPLDPDNPGKIFDLSNLQIVQVVTGMCEMCHKNGTARIMLSSIPFFKEVIITSFECDSCDYRNAEITFGGKLGDLGIKMNCKIVSPAHLNRLVVKSEYATVNFPDLGLEIPAKTQKGSMNSVEGILHKMIEGLEEGQEDRKKIDLENYKKLEEFIELAKKYASGEKLPFTITIDDPSGNSYIQNPYAPNSDPYNTVEYYIRKKEQLVEMGYMAGDEEEEVEKGAEEQTKAELEEAGLKLGGAQKKDNPEALKTVAAPIVKLPKKPKQHLYSEEEIASLLKKMKEIKQKQEGPSIFIFNNKNSGI